ncbi:Peptidyl-prolyl cis-trans isomerase-like 4 [Phytophthora boehmeriae]|uniref:Peptidyl-prolyl cis-trans isomerase n=1 Tax=Phytophthora boehmeriae TaxID=109152 RepID=A0A8T1WU37_9STRA|nr:Peptidyl-prolyl cis-trans isomerase-like 4 [Phytophthora boehmeriae]
MSVLVETTLGALVLDLFVDECPLACTNFLKLCKTKYYHGCLFFNVQENFMVQAGDPTATGTGGDSIYGALYGAQARFFEDELPKSRARSHEDRSGLVGMASAGSANQNASQFYITTRAEDMAYLDEQHTLFGEVAEGMDVLDKINSLFVDDEYRPYQDVRIKHTYVLEDPFPDPKGLAELIPPASPTRERPEQEQVEPRLAADEKLDDNEGRTEQEIEKAVREKEAKSRAVVLEMIGDLPDADVKPPEEVLFVCKLNPVTESADLDMAFCRFGPCKSEVIRDVKTGDSLCFAFVEFTDRRHCEEAYFKMNNVLLDDRRIKVDFSQSVSKLWNKAKRRGEKMSKSDGDAPNMRVVMISSWWKKKNRTCLHGDRKAVVRVKSDRGAAVGTVDDRLLPKEMDHDPSGVAAEIVQAAEDRIDVVAQVEIDTTIVSVNEDVEVVVVAGIRTEHRETVAAAVPIPVVERINTTTATVTEGAGTIVQTRDITTAVDRTIRSTLGNYAAWNALNGLNVR